MLEKIYFKVSRRLTLAVLAASLCSCGEEGASIDLNNVPIRDIAATSLTVAQTCTSQFTTSIANKTQACINFAETTQNDPMKANCLTEQSRLKAAFEIYLNREISDATNFRKICAMTNIKNGLPDESTYQFCDKEFTKFLSDRLGADCALNQMELRNTVFSWRISF